MTKTEEANALRASLATVPTPDNPFADLETDFAGHLTDADLMEVRAFCRELMEDGESAEAALTLVCTGKPFDTITDAQRARCLALLVRK